MITVYGTGAVGLVLGASLVRAGTEVLFVTRGAETARRVEAEGVRVGYPETGEAWTARAPAVAGAAAAPGGIGEGPVLLCTRGPQVESAAAALHEAAPDAVVACFQNDVDNEEKLARHFATVLGVAFRQTCTRTAPNAAVAVTRGRLALGLHPGGASPHAEALAARLRGAGYDVGVSQRIGEDKWLKLCVNLMSTPNALIRREDHATRAFVELKARLLEEAAAALGAAGIVARSCDGRDRSLAEEIAHQRESLARGTSARAIPVYNQVWAVLKHGGPLEADGYHRRILALADEHGTPAGLNARVLAALERAVRQGLGPESLGAAELLGEG